VIENNVKMCQLNDSLEETLKIIASNDFHKINILIPARRFTTLHIGFFLPLGKIDAIDIYRPLYSLSIQYFK